MLRQFKLLSIVLSFLTLSSFFWSLLYEYYPNSWLLLFISSACLLGCWSIQIHFMTYINIHTEKKKNLNNHHLMSVHLL
ncbi:hypothetical protein SJAG_06111 [Schizosaccharomyces japonicus yFS275]|uniref:Uncharacterized protein n=1 Tax=Schizosaccharomyces japonicus (strain yFS275 / FY16936) TaxID=402676 RepID=T0T6F0_SCHJY|nr:hypothetical protein SJAG_06111 [Schizosaccharomyces japonicus yFS275]EQC53009.1 hypothetical protein SJAG_06111 [Schizosaccharomyces japonicus yFS275]